MNMQGMYNRPRIRLRDKMHSATLLLLLFSLLLFTGRLITPPSTVQAHLGASQKFKSDTNQSTNIVSIYHTQQETGRLIDR